MEDQKYTPKQLSFMRDLLAKRDIEQSEDKTLYDVFREGCTGWDNFDDDFVIENFELHFGDCYLTDWGN